MAKITIDNILASFASTTSINARFQQIEDELNDKVLYRDNPVGEPNSMSNDLDVNFNDILNLPAPTTGLSPIRLQDLTDIVDTLPGSTTALLTSITDGTGYYSASHVEGALDQIGSTLIKKVDSKASAVLLDPTVEHSLYISSEDGKGNIWRAITGAAISTYTDDGGSFCGTVFIPTGGDGSSAWVRDFNGPVNLIWFGGTGKGIIDDTAAINAWLLSSDSLLITNVGDGYLFSSKITISSGKTIYSDGASLLKNYDGVGLEINTGADFVTFHGELFITGIGTFAGDGTVSSTSPLAHGLEIIGSRIRLMGALYADNHIGDGVRITASGNANGCIFNNLHGRWNNGTGIYCTGIQDDQSVWDITWVTFGNYAGGVYLDNTYPGRNWRGSIFNQVSTNDGVSDGVYLGGLTDSAITIYSEEGVTTGFEINVGVSSSDLRIEDQRANITNNDGTNIVFTRGGNLEVFGSGQTYGNVRAPSLNDETDVITKNFTGASGNIIAKEVLKGNGQIGLHAIQYAGTEQTAYELAYNGYTLQSYGNDLLSTTRTANGTETTPTPKIVGEDAVIFSNTVYTGADYAETSSINYEIVSLGGGNKASVDLIYNITTIGATAPTEKFRMQSDGDFQLSIAGKGIIVVSPDGLTTKRIGIDNSGNLILS